MRSSFLETRDPAEALEHLGKGHDLGFRPPLPGRFHMRLHQVDYGSWKSDTLRFGAGAFDCEPRGDVLVALVKSGRIQVTTGRDVLSVPRGELVVTADATHRHTTEYIDADLRIVALPLSTLERVAHGSGTVPEGRRLALLDHRPVTAQAGQRLAQVMGLAGRHLIDRESPPEQVMLDAIGHVVAATLLTTFPNTLVTEASPLRPRTDVPATVARAQDFIARNADLPITPSDIARCAGVSKRALEMAFRQHLSLSPAAYLRRYRLARVHDSLRSATPGDGTSVTRLAARWGFTDPSRFVQHYRAVYEQLPSATLREDG